MTAPIIGIYILSFLYGIGFVDIPATRSEMDSLKGRVQKLEIEQDDVGEQLKEIREQNSRDGQKLDDVKQNVDRLVNALIDDGMKKHK